MTMLKKHDARRSTRAMVTTPAAGQRDAQDAMGGGEAMLPTMNALIYRCCTTMGSAA